MPWQIPVFIRVFVASILAPIFIKRVAGAPSRSRSLVLQYALAAGIAAIWALSVGVNFRYSGFYIVFVLGIFGAASCYCEWRAIDISLTKTSLFAQADDILALILGYLILHEGRLVNGTLKVGVLLAVLAVFLFIYGKIRQASGEGSSPARSLALWITGFSLIAGATIFSMRYFALAGMAISTFLFAKYAGSFIGAVLLFYITGPKERGLGMTPAQRFLVFILALIILSAMTLAYWSFTLVPITVAQPIYQVSEIIFPFMIGLWFFKEGKRLNAFQKSAMILGIISTTMIALAY